MPNLSSRKSASWVADLIRPMITKEALIGSLGGIPQCAKATAVMPSPFSPKPEVAQRRT
jgi:hypothetical protein